MLKLVCSRGRYSTVSQRKTCPDLLRICIYFLIFLVRTKHSMRTTLLLLQMLLKKNKCTMSLRWTWHLCFLMWDSYASLPFSSKAFISDKVGEARKEWPVRVRNPWPVSVHHKCREDTAGLTGCGWAEGKKESQRGEERQLGDSAAPLPDLDHSVSSTQVRHTCTSTHTHTRVDWHFPFDNSFFDAATNEHGIWRRRKWKYNAFLAIIRICLHCGTSWNSTHDRICVTFCC